MFDFELPENLSIFIDNLCVYHVFFDLVSFLAIIFTWWFCRHLGSDSQQPVISSESQEPEESTKWPENDNIVSNIKKMRQKVIIKEVESKLTEDELEKEKEVERLQLEKIFQLLQKQEEKFHVTSMEQLEDQLHLYRI